MAYDFETHPCRKAVGSFKWDAMTQINPDVSDEIVPLSVADMEFLTPPPIVSGLKSFLDTAILGYSGAPQSYLDAAIDWFKERHDFDVDSTWIINTHGVIPAFFTAVDFLSKPGESVALMSPVYYPFFDAIRAKDRKLIDCPLVQKGLSYEMDLEHFETLVIKHEIKLLLFCSPHNPVGRVWTRDELKALGDILIKHDVMLVSDEIHNDIIMPGHKHTVFQSISDEIADRCITMTAATKSFNLAGVGVSCIIIKNPDLRKRFVEQLKKNAAIPHAILPYVATEIAYRECKDWFKEMLALVWENYTYLCDFMAEHIPRIKVTQLEGTYLAWIDCRALGMNHLELEEFMVHKALLFLDEGHIFGEVGRGFERINLAVPHQVIIAALERFERALLTCRCTEDVKKD